MEFIDRISEITRSLDKLEDLERREIAAKYDLDGAVLNRDTLETVRSVSTSLKRIVEDRGRASMNKLQKSRDVENGGLDLDHRHHQAFLKSFEIITSLEENIAKNLDNEKWIKNQEWNKIASDHETLESKILQAEARISENFFDLQQKLRDLDQEQ